MKIVRKRLSVDELQPTGTRWNSGTDMVQTTPDGGTTWNDAPGLDVRHADSYRLPPLTGGSAQCDAAARMAAYLNVQIDNFLNSVSLAQAATGALGIMLLFLGGAGIIIDAIIAGMDVLITIGTTAISSAFSVGTYESLKCTFDCHLDANGQMTAAGLAAFQADVHLNYSSTVYDTLVAIGAFTGEVGYSNAAVERSETGDCTACECDHCYKIDLASTDGSEVGLAILAGTWHSGCCIRGQNDGAGNLSDLTWIWTFPSTIHVKSASVEFYKGGGGGADNQNRFTLLNPIVNYREDVVVQDNSNPVSLDSRLTKTMTANDDCTGLGQNINSGDFDTFCEVYSITIIYSGDEVFGGDNC